jgi:hypothetical protein
MAVSAPPEGRRLFYAAAAWNAAAAAASAARPSPDPLGWHLAALCIAVFALAYLWIARDPPGHRDLIRLGLIGKPFVFLICLGHVLFGHAAPAMAVGGLGDLVFAVLFWRYLGRHPAP